MLALLRSASYPVSFRRLDGFATPLLSALPSQSAPCGSGGIVARYLHSDGRPDSLLARLGQLLLREDRDFHTIQTIEAAFKQYEQLQRTEAGTHVLIAAARYLAAHSPTVRAQGQTYSIASRLHRGEKIFEE
jgi:hypothetical protein